MPTAARQKYLAKQAAKQADRLSESDRQAEYDKVFSQLGQISAPEVDKFEALMSEWVKDGNVRQGVIPVPAIRRAVVYSLGISRSKTFVSLRSDNPDEYMPDSTSQAPVASNNPTVSTQDVTNNNTEDEEQPPELVPSTDSGLATQPSTESQSQPAEQSTNQSTGQPINIIN